jgi:hypothetical protein
VKPIGVAPGENLLISAGEDCTALVWDMTKIPGLKK